MFAMFAASLHASRIQLRCRRVIPEGSNNVRGLPGSVHHECGETPTAHEATAQLCWVKSSPRPVFFMLVCTRTLNPLSPFALTALSRMPSIFGSKSRAVPTGSFA